MTSPIPALSAADIGSYLRSKGWERDGNWRGAGVWRLGEQARLLIPEQGHRDDDEDLIREALRKVAKYEQRPERDILLEITEPMVDTQYFKVHPNAPAGSIPLPVGMRAVTGIHDLIKAAATTVENGPRLLFEGRRSSRIETFLQSVLLGSAAPGSYVLTARIPAQPVTQQQLFGTSPDEEFSGRAVARQLRLATQAAYEATELVVRQHGEFSVFYDALERGVSANLCRALSELGGQGKQNPFEIGFAWARGVRGDEPTGEIAFTSTMPAVLARAGDELAALARGGTAEITGEITDLHDRRGERPRVKIAGQLRLHGATNYPRRSIWVVLTASDYDLAIDAHRNEQNVAVSGRLNPGGRRLELHATAFLVIR
jgi:hypothetical protein